RAAASELPVDAISPNPQQPRRIFADADLDALADSIRRHGVLQPIVVREAPAGAPRRYELVVGERRWRASQRAGRATIPATIQNLTPSSLLEVALVENVQRRDLNPIELALAFRTLVEAGRTQEEIGAQVGLERPTIANHLRLLDLAKEAQEDVESGRLSVGHAKALLQLTNPERRSWLRDRILAEQLSVRAAEELARELAGPRPERAPSTRTRTPSAVDPNLRALTDQLERHLMTRVRVHAEGRRGKLEIEFASAEELSRLAALILDGRRL
ncbi:MAG TPA: ParB/RepB/Spo0J family partition protein, partial [Myxococcota bacterium]|nr:ParB/RepB/Spo0J family partition protein [Myxococcota bacterium]